MVEDQPHEKNDEEYPLLKVESGAGDNGRPLPAAGNPGWSVTCSPRRSLLDRWPELISACWMTGMLLGIFFLILYGLGLGVIRRQPFLAVNCNVSQPTKEVYYHHIVQRGSAIPLGMFSEYLANVASLYSSLRFNVIFLIDDNSVINRGPRRHSTKELMNKFDEYNQQELKEFQLKYKNVNFTIMSLGKFMAATPLRYKWKGIAMAYLTFYARAFSVWQNGGIAIDLSLFNKQFRQRLLPDRRISAIFEQHNNGIKPDEYTSTLSNIDRDEQNELFSLFYGIIHQFLNESQKFINRTLIYSPDKKDKVVPKTSFRTHRSKRDALNMTTSDHDHVDTTNKKINASVNYTEIAIVESAYQNTIDDSSSVRKKSQSARNDLPTWLKLENVHHENITLPALNLTANISEPNQIFLFYDFSLLSDANLIGPSNIMPQPNSMSIFEMQPVDEVNSVSNPPKKSPYLLSINSEGFFIAASSKQHPFLSRIITGVCQRMPPRFVIQDAFRSQCSPFLKECANIYIFDNY